MFYSVYDIYMTTKNIKEAKTYDYKTCTRLVEQAIKDRTYQEYTVKVAAVSMGYYAIELHKGSFSYEYVT